MALLLRAGADAQRLIDGQGWPLERFARHISRLTVLRGSGAHPLVVLTETNPIALAVLQTRRVLAEAVPELEQAPWVIFHDESADPFFASSALGMGTFDIGYELGPIWLTPPGYQFLVLSSDERQLDYVAARLATLEHSVAFSTRPGDSSED